MTETQKIVPPRTPFNPFDRSFVFPKFPPRSILFVSSEVYPYAKAGGLADISSAYTQMLREFGHDVRVIMPKYGFIGENKQKIHIINRLQGMDFNVGGKTLLVNAKSSAILTQRTRVQIYLVENEEYFQRPGLYSDPATLKDYPDNDERFILFAESIFETCRRLLWKPEVIHCNDWQTGMIPLLLKTKYKDDPFFADTKCVFTIHDISRQGNFPLSAFAKTGLSKDQFSTEKSELGGKFSFLKTGVAYADAITTVSPTYAEEIRTEAVGGELEELLKKRKRVTQGILYGIDLDIWNPAKDTNIVKPYTYQKLDNKEECKKDLCATMNIPYQRGIPIVGMISRLNNQRGTDLVVETLDQILKLGVQLVVLGAGDHKYEEFFARTAKKYPNQVGYYQGFHDNFTHKIAAGADLLLVPSASEPCGLNQLYSMHYGTPAVVRAVGGLSDTVVDVEEGTRKLPATGFNFKKHDPSALLKALTRAILVYKTKPEEWRELQIDGMTKDLSWFHSAHAYAQLYEKVLSKH